MAPFQPPTIYTSFSCSPELKVALKAMAGQLDTSLSGLVRDGLDEFLIGDLVRLLEVRTPVPVYLSDPEARAFDEAALSEGLRRNELFEKIIERGVLQTAPMAPVGASEDWRGLTRRPSVSDAYAKVLVSMSDRADTEPKIMLTRLVSGYLAHHTARREPKVIRNDSEVTCIVSRLQSEKLEALRDVGIPSSRVFREWAMRAITLDGADLRDVRHSERNVVQVKVPESLDRRIRAAARGSHTSMTGWTLTALQRAYQDVEDPGGDRPAFVSPPSGQVSVLAFDARAKETGERGSALGMTSDEFVRTALLSALERVDISRVGTARSILDPILHESGPTSKQQHWMPDSLTERATSLASKLGLTFDQLVDAACGQALFLSDSEALEPVAPTVQFKTRVPRSLNRMLWRDAEARGASVSERVRAVIDVNASLAVKEPVEESTVRSIAALRERRLAIENRLRQLDPQHAREADSGAEDALAERGRIQGKLNTAREWLSKLDPEKAEIHRRDHVDRLRHRLGQADRVACKRIELAEQLRHWAEGSAPEREARELQATVLRLEVDRLQMKIGETLSLAVEPPPYIRSLGKCPKDEVAAKSWMHRAGAEHALHEMQRDPTVSAEVRSDQRQDVRTLTRTASIEGIGLLSS